MELFFEAAWDKTIAPQDRQTIIDLFNETKSEKQHPIIRVATNHRQQLLVSVLLHNWTEHTITFNNRRVTFQTPQQSIESFFTTSSLVIPPKMSTPWTFIFDEQLEQTDEGTIIIHDFE